MNPDHRAAVKQITGPAGELDITLKSLRAGTVDDEAKKKLMIAEALLRKVTKLAKEAINAT